jgi:replicative DNA helicase
MKQSFNFAILAQEVVEPEYFSDKTLAWFFVTLRDHYLDYQINIQDTTLDNELIKAVRSKRIKDKDIPTFVKYRKELDQPVLNSDYIKSEVVTFCKHQAIRKAITDLPPLLQGDRFDELEEMLVKALHVGMDVDSLGVQFFVDYPERIRRRELNYEHKIIPTGITELDAFLAGGMKPKQLGIWMGPTNRGKSLALIHCGKRAIIQRKKVLHYTLELSEDEVAERYDSSFSAIPMRKLVHEEYELMGRLEDLGRRWGNALIIKEWPPGKASVNTIKGHIRQCFQIGFIPDLIIVDYLDLLKPAHKRKEKREELSDITTDLRGLSVELARGVWSATQSRRAAISMETHTEEEVGDDIGKVNIADIVITLNQTREEVKNEMMRLFLAKNRNGRKYIEIPIETAFDRMCFYQPPKMAA